MVLQNSVYIPTRHLIGLSPYLSARERTICTSLAFRSSRTVHTSGVLCSLVSRLTSRQSLSKEEAGCIETTISISHIVDVSRRFVERLQKLFGRFKSARIVYNAWFSALRFLSSVTVSVTVSVIRVRTAVP